MPRGGDDQCEHKDHRQRRAHSNRLAWQRDADFERRIAAVRRGGLRTDGSTIAHIGRTKRHLLHATTNNSVLNDHQQSQQYRNPGTKRINEWRRNQRSLFAGHHGATGTSATVLRTRSSSTADGLMLARLNVGSSTTKAVRRGAGRARGSPVHSTQSACVPEGQPEPVWQLACSARACPFRRSADGVPRSLLARAHPPRPGRPLSLKLSTDKPRRGGRSHSIRWPCYECDTE